MTKNKEYPLWKYVNTHSPIHTKVQTFDCYSINNEFMYLLQLNMVRWVLCKQVLK